MTNLRENYGRWKGQYKTFLPVQSTPERDVTALALGAKNPVKHVFMTQRAYSRVVFSDVIGNTGRLVGSVLFGLQIYVGVDVFLRKLSCGLLDLSLFSVSYGALVLLGGYYLHRDWSLPCELITQAIEEVRVRLKASDLEQKREEIERALTPYFGRSEIHRLFPSKKEN